MTDRTLIAPTKRRAMNKSRRVKIFLENNGRCGGAGQTPYGCGNRIVDGDKWEIEHRVALTLGGPDEDDNCYPIHVKCHKAKTRDDKRAMSKRNKAVDRGYAGKQKPKSKFKRKMDGTVVDRATGEPVRRGK